MTFRRGVVLLAVAGLLAAAAPGAAEPPAPAAARASALIEDMVTRIVDAGLGIDLGVLVSLEGNGVLYERRADELLPAASAVKSFILLDLLVRRGDRLDEVPAGVEYLLWPGNHDAFLGFGEEDLEAARAVLPGCSYRELAGIMMGRTGAGNAVYNAACNVLLLKLGGPAAVGERLRALDPAFAGLDLHRYMFQWFGDGDNLVSPRTLAALYAAVSADSVPGLDGPRTAVYRDLLREEGTGGPGTVYGKAGTLYPSPMIRVRAGYEERGGQDLVFAILGRMENPDVRPADAFVKLLAVVDTATVLLRELP